MNDIFGIGDNLRAFLKKIHGRPFVQCDVCSSIVIVQHFGNEKVEWHRISWTTARQNRRIHLCRSSCPQDDGERGQSSKAATRVICTHTCVRDPNASVSFHRARVCALHEIHTSHPNRAR